MNLIREHFQWFGIVRKLKFEDRENHTYTRNLVSFIPPSPLIARLRNDSKFARGRSYSAFSDILVLAGISQLEQFWEILNP